jgi:lipid A ethanolaminephosphotransferase
MGTLGPALVIRLRRSLWGPEFFLLALSLFWVLVANRAFFAALGADFSQASGWLFALAMAVFLLATHGLLLALTGWRGLFKPVLSVLILMAAGTSYFTGQFGIYLDPSMVRNVMRTDLAESRELISMALLLHMLLVAGLPMWLLWRMRLEPRPFLVGIGRRLVFAALMVVLALAAVLSVFQPFASLMRNHKEVRYLITPANAVWSLGQVLWGDAQGAVQPRQAIGLDARMLEAPESRQRPLVLVLVLGETVRAANWGLNGYARQTTPQLAALDVMNAGAARSCGTNTEVSVPCMFAPVGRRDYDEKRIRGQESLLHVLHRAGVQVHWRDNQSGCKGVCDGLPLEMVTQVMAPDLCEGGRCLDEALFRDLEDRLRNVTQTRQVHVWVLHMLGNHGPSYFRRYPADFARFKPECLSDDLKACSVPEIVNAYDNAVLYTDHLLAQAIRKLQAHQDKVDSALLYVSDHGESLGEKGLFLHGIPYAIAPDVQTQVPMVFWSSGGFAEGSGVATDCLRKRWTAGSLSHDHLFHSLLGLLGVETSLHEKSLDLTEGCRRLAGH